MTMTSVLPPSRYGPVFFKADVSEARSSPSARTLPAHNIGALSFQDDVIPVEFTNSHDEGSTRTKRPRLLADMKVESPIGGVCVPSGPLPGSAAGHATPSLSTSSPQVHVGGICDILIMSHDLVRTSVTLSISQGPGLSAYLEDIESDEGDLMVDDDEKPPGTPPPEVAPRTPPATSGGLCSQHSKEQLLQKMETVDRDIAATEEQISTLQKRQVKFLTVTLIGWLADDLCVSSGRVRGECSFHSLHLHPLPSPSLSPPPLLS